MLYELHEWKEISSSPTWHLCELVLVSTQKNFFYVFGWSDLGRRLQRLSLSNVLLYRWLICFLPFHHFVLVYQWIFFLMVFFSTHWKCWTWYHIGKTYVFLKNWLQVISIFFFFHHYWTRKELRIIVFFLHLLFKVLHQKEVFQG